MQNILPFWLRLHRWFGLLSTVVVILWCVSGIIHIYMARVQPEPVQQRYTHNVPSLVGAITPTKILNALGITEITDLRVIVLNNKAYYQITLPKESERLVFDAFDGKVLTNGDRLYAEELARTFTGEQEASVIRAKLVTEFGNQYNYLNRRLPVWCIEFNRSDGMRAFVDTRNSELALLMNNVTSFGFIEFATLHRWLWLKQISPGLRYFFLESMVIFTLLTAGLGLWIYGLKWKRISAIWGLRRIHRNIGLLAALATLMMPLSGSIYMLNEAWNGDSSSRYVLPEILIPVDKLTKSPAEIQASVNFEFHMLSLARIDDVIAYRLGNYKENERNNFNGRTIQITWVSVENGKIIPDAEASYTRSQVKLALGRDIFGKVQHISQFSREYPFAFKRLPVEKIDIPEIGRFFIDPADGAISAMTKPSDAFAGFSIMYVHNFGWLTSLGENMRDIVHLFFAIALLLTAVIGGVLALRKWRYKQ